MKTTKIISLIVSILLLTSIAIISSSAVSPDDYDYKVDNVYFPKYVKNDGTWFYTIPENSSEITLLGYHGDEKDIVIPEEIDGYPVTTISVYGYSHWWGGVEETAFPIFENSIESITIPKTITLISTDYTHDFSPIYHQLKDTDGYVYFKGYFRSGLTNLKEFIVDDENKYFSSKDGVLFNKDKTVLISYPRNKANKEYTMPNTVKCILDCAFYRVNESGILKKITITENVEGIGWLTGNEWDYSLDTIDIRNVKMTKEILKSKLWANKEIIVYKDSNAHEYYKNYIEKKNPDSLPKLTVLNNPHIEKDEKSESKKTTSKKENSTESKKNTSEKQQVKETPSKFESTKTESIVSKPLSSNNSASTDRKASTDNTVSDNESKNTSKLWVIVVIAAAVLLVGGGVTAHTVFKKK